MYIFKIFKHPVLGLEVIKDDFSWPGFFFTWIWAFVKKLWLQGIILLTIEPALIILGFYMLQGNALGVTLGVVLIFLPSFVVGQIGNSWREKSMSERGYELVGSVAAHSTDDALAKF